MPNAGGCSYCGMSVCEEHRPAEHHDCTAASQTLTDSSPDVRVDGSLSQEESTKQTGGTGLNFAPVATGKVVYLRSRNILFRVAQLASIALVLAGGILLLSWGFLNLSYRTLPVQLQSLWVIKSPVGNVGLIALGAVALWALTRTKTAGY